MTAKLDRALARINRRVIDRKGVVGTALGLRRGKPCILVYLERDDAKLKAKIPGSEGGVPVVVRVTGRIQGQ